MNTVNRIVGLAWVLWRLKGPRSDYFQGGIECLAARASALLGIKLRPRAIERALDSVRECGVSFQFRYQITRRKPNGGYGGSTTRWFLALHERDLPLFGAIERHGAELQAHAREARPGPEKNSAGLPIHNGTNISSLLDLKSFRWIQRKWRPGFFRPVMDQEALDRLVAAAYGHVRGSLKTRSMRKREIEDRDWQGNQNLRALEEDARRHGVTDADRRKEREKVQAEIDALEWKGISSVLPTAYQESSPLEGDQANTVSAHTPPAVAFSSFRAGPMPEDGGVWEAIFANPATLTGTPWEVVITTLDKLHGLVAQLPAVMLEDLAFRLRPFRKPEQALAALQKALNILGYAA
ncbi:MAG: hypothetical protein H8E31_13770 [Planctomycetes bacterium]|nr:hypothetical protein [Planctomycetota bacterium]